MITLAEGQSRVLHQSPDLAAAADPSFDPQARAAELRGEAERSLRMARVLAAGGFAEEALPLIAKAIGIGAAARLAALGELAAGNRWRRRRRSATWSTAASWLPGGGSAFGAMVRCWRAHCCRRGIPYRQRNARCRKDK